ncbi:hypothetical protein GOP47_0015635 [Adiantum capillus-veneris]|uniref:Uncharacterized protein n=1 Tax=Adiantum capillus-veneris TaxID=13818 RepID=A0A9D4UK21_ADICA|nr:hypothetical protein GOP47_0015635 [Adiantum capillus-veneris]
MEGSIPAIQGIINRNQAQLSPLDVHGGLQGGPVLTQPPERFDDPLYRPAEQGMRFMPSFMINNEWKGNIPAGIHFPSASRIVEAAKGGLSPSGINAPSPVVPDNEQHHHAPAYHDAKEERGNSTNSNYFDVLLEDVFDPYSAQVHADADGEGKPSQEEEDGTSSPKCPQPPQVPPISPKDSARGRGGAVIGLSCKWANLVTNVQYSNKERSQCWQEMKTLSKNVILTGDFNMVEQITDRSRSLGHVISVWGMLQVSQARQGVHVCKCASGTLVGSIF